jgi:membrane protease YdiL (CAAX protease family)
MKNIINWKLFFILLIVCVITSIFVIPYSMALTSSELEITVFIVLITVAQNLVLFAIAVFLGLFFSQKIGFRLPVLQGILEKENQNQRLKSILPLSICLGVLAGVLIILVDIPFNRLIPAFQNISISIPAWKAFLASFYGGIAEEVLLRLFLVSFLVWITYKIKKNKDGCPTNFGIWFSIILAAVIFGLGHLPATSQITALTGVVISRAIVLNGIGGVIFGWLYWKKGLESAMIAHFSTDIVLHIITPLIVSIFS